MGGRASLNHACFDCTCIHMFIAQVIFFWYTCLQRLKRGPKSGIREFIYTYKFIMHIYARAYSGFFRGGVDSIIMSTFCARFPKQELGEVQVGVLSHLPSPELAPECVPTFLYFLGRRAYHFFFKNSKIVKKHCADLERTVVIWKAMSFSWKELSITFNSNVFATL